jgi:hypothetical protein
MLNLIGVAVDQLGEFLKTIFINKTSQAFLHLILLFS